MRALGVFPQQKEIRLVEHSPPRLRTDHEVRVRSLEVGICGTDKEISTFACGTPPADSAYLVLGHESLGEVLETGSGVSRFQPGDLVVPSVRRPCRHERCLPCREGRQDFCATGDFTERGIKKRHGFLTEVYVEEEQYLTRVPRSLRDVGVLVEPLTVTVKALTQVWEVQQRLSWVQSKDPATPGLGLNAVVLGAGPVGILAAMALLRCGFKTWVYSRSPKPNPKAELVESLGAIYVSSKEESVGQLAERVGRMDLVYEAVGVGQLAFDVLSQLGINGIFVFTGIPAPRDPAPIPVDALVRQLVLKNQVALGTVNADLKDFQGAVDHLDAFERRWPDALRAVITGRFPLEAYRDLLGSNGHGIKNVITLNG